MQVVGSPESEQPMIRVTVRYFGDKKFTPIVSQKFQGIFKNGSWEPIDHDGIMQMLKRYGIVK